MIINDYTKKINKKTTLKCIIFSFNGHKSKKQRQKQPFRIKNKYNSEFYNMRERSFNKEITVSNCFIKQANSVSIDRPFSAYT